MTTPNITYDVEITIWEAGAQNSRTYLKVYKVTPERLRKLTETMEPDIFIKQKRDDKGRFV